MGDGQRPTSEFDVVLNILVYRVERLQRLRALLAPDATVRTGIALVRDAADRLDLLLAPPGPMAPTRGRMAPVVRLGHARRRATGPRREGAGDAGAGDAGAGDATPPADRGG